MKLSPAQTIIRDNMLKEAFEQGHKLAGDALINVYDKQMRALVQKIYGKYPEEFDDLLQIARMTLLITLKKWDATRKVGLYGYAANCIKWRLSDYMRSVYPHYHVAENIEEHPEYTIDHEGLIEILAYEKLLSQLSETEKDYVIMRISGLSEKEFMDKADSNKYAYIKASRVMKALSLQLEHET